MLCLLLVSIQLTIHRLLVCWKYFRLITDRYRQPVFIARCKSGFLKRLDQPYLSQPVDDKVEDRFSNAHYKTLLIMSQPASVVRLRPSRERRPVSRSKIDWTIGKRKIAIDGECRMLGIRYSSHKTYIILTLLS